MAKQADVDALVVRLKAIEAAQSSLPDRIRAAMASAAASNPDANLDFSAMDAVVSDIENGTTKVTSSLPADTDTSSAPVLDTPVSVDVPVVSEPGPSADSLA